MQQVALKEKHKRGEVLAVYRASRVNQRVELTVLVTIAIIFVFIRFLIPPEHPLVPVWCCVMSLSVPWLIRTVSVLQYDRLIIRTDGLEWSYLGNSSALMPRICSIKQQKRKFQHEQR